MYKQTLNSNSMKWYLNVNVLPTLNHCINRKYILSGQQTLQLQSTLPLPHLLNKVLYYIDNIMFKKQYP